MHDSFLSTNIILHYCGHKSIIISFLLMLNSVNYCFMLFLEVIEVIDLEFKFVMHAIMRGKTHEEQKRLKISFSHNLIALL